MNEVNTETPELNHQPVTPVITKRYVFQSLERPQTEFALIWKVASQADSAGPGSRIRPPSCCLQNGGEFSYLVSRGTDGFVSGASVFQRHCPSLKPADHSTFPSPGVSTEWQVGTKPLAERGLIPRITRMTQQPQAEPREG